MDIKIEAPGHKTQKKLKIFYSKILNEKYSAYDFIKSIDVKIISNSNGTYNVSLQLKPEKSKMLFVSDKSYSENIAFRESIRKMNVKIEKYKEKHYHSVHSAKEQYLQQDF